MADIFKPQHNHHCLLVFDRVPRRIVRVQMPHVVICCTEGCCEAFLDTTGVDFDAYCVAAALNDFAQAASAERGLTVSTGSEARN